MCRCIRVNMSLYKGKCVVVCALNQLLYIALPVSKTIKTIKTIKKRGVLKTALCTHFVRTLLNLAMLDSGAVFL